MTALQDIRGVVASLRRDHPAGTKEQLTCLSAAGQYRRLDGLAARCIRPGGHVLDWGCGRGHFAYFLVKSGIRVPAYSLEHEPEVFGSLSPSEKASLTFVRGAIDEP